MSRPEPGPPRLAGALLERALPAPHGALVRAELDEEYERHVRTSRRTLAARWWYWRQALASILWQLRRPRQALSPLRGFGMDSLLKDARFALRVFARERLFTGVALATIAIGIGATTLVFTVLSAALLRPLPYPEPERLVRLWDGWQLTKDVMVQVSEGTDSFAVLAGLGSVSQPLTGRGEPLHLDGAMVTPEYFDLVGTPPALGRPFRPQESRPGSGRVVILSHGLWERVFGADEGVIGTDIELDGGSRRVVGVMGPGHRPLLRGTEYWIPLVLDPSDFSDYSGVAHVMLFGRLADGLSLERAAADVGAVAEAIHREIPDAYGERWVAAATPKPLHGALVEDSRAGLWTVMAAVSCLLLIACVNVANLLLARAGRRQREMAIRMGLGAGPLRLTRQMLTESLMLGIGGGVLGIALASLLVDGLRAMLPSNLPLAAAVAIDPRVALFALAVSLVVSVLFGIAPALRAARSDPQAQLREASPVASVGRRGSRLHRVLVAGEVALAAVLVIGAGLMLRSLAEMAKVDPGFEPEGLISMRLQLPGASRYAEPGQRVAYYWAVRERLEAFPGIAGASAAAFLPMGPENATARYEVDGVEVPDDRTPPNARFQLVVGDYFGTMEIPLLQGRTFGPEDRDAERTPAVVNRTFAREAFGDADPLGETFTMFGSVRFRVIGVVADSRQHGLTRAPSPEIFFPYEHLSLWPSLYVLVRTAEGAAPDVASIREAIWQVDGNVPISRIREMTEVVASAAADSRFLTRLLGSFAVLALALGAVGIYGVMSYTVGLQAHEFGIRLALGARNTDILRRAALGAVLPALAGIVAGTLAAAGLGGVLGGMLFGVTARDPMTFTAVPALLLAVALLASYLPARRAARIEPKRSLAE